MEVDILHYSGVPCDVFHIFSHQVPRVSKSCCKGLSPEVDEVVRPSIKDVSEFSEQNDMKREQLFVFEELSIESLHNIILYTPELRRENNMDSMVATDMKTHNIYIHVYIYILYIHI